MIPSSLHHDVVCFGEILWDVLPDQMLPGGAPMNVAYHLKKLGINPALITRVGKDGYGDKLVDLLTQSGISTDYVQLDETYLTGLVYAKPNEYNEVTYDIVYPSAWDFIQCRQDCSDLLAQARYFVFGSLTSRSEASRNTLYSLLDCAATKVLDINLRPPHFSRERIEYLLGKTDILKMNSSELELVSGWFSQFKKSEDRMRLLQDRFNIQTVIVTMGGDGAMLLDKGDLCLHKGHRVQVADTIGSGDAFLAGYLSQLIKEVPGEQALTFAGNLGALIATYPGACPDYDPSEITNLVLDAQQKLAESRTIS
jgi:fructokinase